MDSNSIEMYIELIHMVSLIPASVLTRMLLDSTLLTPWGNYRKLVMDLYDKPGKNNSQYSVDLFPWAFFLFFFHCFFFCFSGFFFFLSFCLPPLPPLTLKCFLKDTITRVKNWNWRRAIAPRWQSTSAPLGWMGLAHEWSYTYQQIRLKPNLEICSKQGKLKYSSLNL